MFLLADERSFSFFMSVTSNRTMQLIWRAAAQFYDFSWDLCAIFSLFLFLSSPTTYLISFYQMPCDYNDTTMLWMRTPTRWLRRVKSSAVSPSSAAAAARPCSVSLPHLEIIWLHFQKPEREIQWKGIQAVMAQRKCFFCFSSPCIFFFPVMLPSSAAV